jgi:hypothetical protein
VIPYQHIYQLEKNFYVPQGNVQGSLWLKYSWSLAEDFARSARKNDERKKEYSCYCSLLIMRQTIMATESFWGEIGEISGKGSSSSTCHWSSTTYTPV